MTQLHRPECGSHQTWGRCDCRPDKVPPFLQDIHDALAAVREGDPYPVHGHNGPPASPKHVYPKVDKGDLQDGCYYFAGARWKGETTWYLVRANIFHGRVELYRTGSEGWDSVHGYHEFRGPIPLPD